jgi:hypothetical protein
MTPRTRNFRYGSLPTGSVPEWTLLRANIPPRTLQYACCGELGTYARFLVICGRFFGLRDWTSPDGLQTAAYKFQSCECKFQLTI